MPNFGDYDNESVYDSLDESISMGNDFDEEDELTQEEVNEFLKEKWGVTEEEQKKAEPKGPFHMEPMVSEVLSEDELPPKVGFFQGTWNAIKTFFTNLFRSAPKEEAPKAEAPKAEEQPMLDTPDIPDKYIKDPSEHRVHVERVNLQALVDDLEYPNAEFVKQVNDIAENGPDDVRRFLAFASEGMFRQANDTFGAKMDEIDGMDITDRQKEILKNNAVKDMVEQSIEESGRDIDAEIERAEMRNMGMEEISNILE